MRGRGGFGAALAALTGAAALVAAPCGSAVAQTSTPPGARKAQPAKPAGAASATPAATAPSLDEYKQRFAGLCAACHGADGLSSIEGTPSLAGQHSFYVTTQLFLFREGRRDNAAMTAVAKGFTDNDLRGFSAVIDALPPIDPPAPSTSGDPARVAKAAELAREHKCVFCHGTDLAGGAQVPRIGGQREEYLRATLRGFKDGTRPGYTLAMIGAVSQVPVEDLDLLAWYSARFRAK